MLFLEDEVHHLDDAHVYFKNGGKNPAKSDNAIDLLLGTQGYENEIDAGGGKEKERKRKGGEERRHHVHAIFGK
jgi:hypothetical protein